MSCQLYLNWEKKGREMTLGRQSTHHLYTIDLKFIILSQTPAQIEVELSLCWTLFPVAIVLLNKV